MHYPESYRQHRPGSLPGANAKGFSIVELLVAMVITLILLGGLFQVYLSNKVTYKFGEALSRVQENGRFAMDYLGTEIRMADYWGCAGAADVQNNLDNTDPNFIDFGAGGLLGNDGGGLNGSDSITIGGVSGSQITVQQPYMPTVAAALMITQDSGLQIDDVVLVSDCVNGDIFQVTNMQQGSGGNSDKETLVHNQGTGSIGNISNNLSKRYEGDASVSEATSKTFFLQNNPIGEPALYVTVNGATSELVEGVENMQILYGEDTGGDLIPDRYRPANTVTDMGAVIAVRISLLIRSFQDNVVDDPQTYTYNGAAVTAGDRRLRQVFTSTITLRNRTK